MKSEWPNRHFRQNKTLGIINLEIKPLIDIET